MLTLFSNESEELQDFELMNKEGVIKGNLKFHVVLDFKSLKFKIILFFSNDFWFGIQLRLKSEKIFKSSRKNA